MSQLLYAEAANGAAGGSNLLPSLIMIVLLVVMFIFFVYRPQKKQEKEKNDMMNSLAVGDEITTIGGIIGKIVSMKDETVLIETSRDCTRIRILRSAISRVDVKAEDAK